MPDAYAPPIEFPMRTEPYGPEDLAYVPGARVVGGVLVLETDLTVEQVLDRYPETPNIQLVEGRLVVCPMANVPHQRAMLQVTEYLSSLPPGQWEALAAVNIRVAEKGLPIPDVAVVRPGVGGLYVEAADVALVVEILSPSTEAYDRSKKLSMWLENVPEVWLIDLGERTIEVYTSEFVPARASLPPPPVALGRIELKGLRPRR